MQKKNSEYDNISKKCTKRVKKRTNISKNVQIMLEKINKEERWRYDDRQTDAYTALVCSCPHCSQKIVLDYNRTTDAEAMYNTQCPSCSNYFVAVVE